MKKFRQKTAKNHVILGLILALFFAMNFHFRSQRAPKNDFHIKSLLETCWADIVKMSVKTMEKEGIMKSKSNTLKQVFLILMITLVCTKMFFNV